MLTAKVDKAEAIALSMQAKMGDQESDTNHMRRILKSKTEDKETLEAKLEAAIKEKERQMGLTQNL